MLYLWCTDIRRFHNDCCNLCLNDYTIVRTNISLSLECYEGMQQELELFVIMYSRNVHLFYH